jgi:post-segregation antitoxin (ccd killing protein)
MADVKTRSNAPKGEREFVATRIPAADKPKLVERARQAGLSVSEYLDRLIAEDLKKVA